MENGLSAADVALLNNNDGWGGNSMMWIFALLILAGGGFGGLGFNNRGYQPQYATQDFVQNGFNFNDLQDQNRDLSNLITNGTAQSVAATNQVYHDIVGNLGDKYYELARDVAGVNNAVATAIANQNDCCCSTKMMIADAGANLSAQIAQNRYDTAMGLAGLEQRLTAKMDANTIQTLRDQVDSLRDQVNMSGVLRFPNSWSYGAGPFPPLFPNCCGANV